MDQTTATNIITTKAKTAIIQIPFCQETKGSTSIAFIILNLKGIKVKYRIKNKYDIYQNKKELLYKQLFYLLVYFL